jgi:hypothetical protein
MNDYEKDIQEIKEKKLKMAEGLEWVAKAMQSYCEVLRGERRDMTGIGEWRIITQNLELIAGIKISEN